MNRMYGEVNIGEQRILPPVMPKVQEPVSSYPVNPITEDIEIQEDEEESLSLEDREKELIQKALEKHRARRKNAAEELGISERTLYRKIKEYDIQG